MPEKIAATLIFAAPFLALALIFALVETARVFAAIRSEGRS